jgi:transposase, IS605 orfB family
MKLFPKIREAKAKVQYEWLTERHVIRSSNKSFPFLEKLAHKANNVYNQGLYRIRHKLFQGKWMNYCELDQSFKTSRDNRDSMLYESMGNIHLVQQVLKVVCQDMSSWKKTRDAYRKAPKKFNGYPKLPSYKKKGGMVSFVVDNQTAKLRSNGIVEIPCMNNFKVELWHKDVKKIQQVRVVPTNGVFIVEIVYKTEKVIEYKPDNGRYLTIDPGVNNAFACASNVKGFQPVVFNGRPIKSVNQFYNKERARLRSIHELSRQREQSHRLDRLDFKRNQKIERYAHEVSKRIAELALSHECNTIVIGRNKGLKNGSQMYKKNNQNFIGIPHDKMLQMITYKANLLGIVVIPVNEAYSSQTSFLDGEEVIPANGDKARTRRGIKPAKRRFKRGLYRSNDGTILNADINAAYQILRKVVPNAFADGIEGVVLRPIMVAPTRIACAGLAARPTDSPRRESA